MASLILGSITHLPPHSRGQHVLTGSHGGAYTAGAALSAGVASLICHDAGVGLDAAGIGGLALLADADLPAAAVDFRSARIGDAHDILARGVISHVNEAAARCGVAQGGAAAQAFTMFQAIPPRPTTAAAPPAPTGQESRSIIPFRDARDDQCDIIAVDSASLIRPDDAGRIVVTGSHGGLPDGIAANAVKAPVHVVVFNDAGVGIDEAGIGRLPVLDGRGIAALTVSASSARIGDAHSSYETGVISRANRVACSYGAQPGQLLRVFFRILANR